MELRLKNNEVKLSEENEQGLTYLKFTKVVRHLIVEANPSAAHTKINMHLGALWSDYKKKKGTGAVTPSVPSPKSSGGKALRSKRTQPKLPSLQNHRFV